MSVLVVMSPNTVTTDLDKEMVSCEYIGKEKTEGGKERRQTLAWLQAQWHWCQAVKRSCPCHRCTLVVLVWQLANSFQPVWERMYTEINLCKSGECRTSVG